MVNIILLSIITSLFIFGWHYATLYTPNNTFIPSTDPTKPAKRVEIKPNDYEILGLFRYYIRCLLIKIFPYHADYIIKPLFGCPVCMSSVYGSAIYWGYVINSNQIMGYKTFILWGLNVVCTAGLNTIIRNR